eukprot:CFRG3794T1
MALIKSSKSNLSHSKSMPKKLDKDCQLDFTGICEASVVPIDDMKHGSRHKFRKLLKTKTSKVKNQSMNKSISSSSLSMSTSNNESDIPVTLTSSYASLLSTDSNARFLQKSKSNENIAIRKHDIKSALSNKLGSMKKKKSILKFCRLCGQDYTEDENKQEHIQECAIKIMETLVDVDMKWTTSKSESEENKKNADSLRKQLADIQISLEIQMKKYAELQNELDSTKSGAAEERRKWEAKGAQLLAKIDRMRGPWGNFKKNQRGKKKAKYASVS